MEFQNSWKVGDGPTNEDEKLKVYYDEVGGLFFTEFNTTQGQRGKLRALDAIRFPDLETGIYKSSGNYDTIRNLIPEHSVELIEVHKWGFYVLGQLIGKYRITEKYWDPKEAKRF